MASIYKGESLVTLFCFVQKLTSFDCRTGYVRDPGLKGVAWSNPFVAPCSSDGIRECGALASDFQVRMSFQKATMATDAAGTNQAVVEWFAMLNPPNGFNPASSSVWDLVQGKNKKSKRRLALKELLML
eukprot:1152146-Pelagomonas_calceolata.AAC.1